jgi:hypothetical protein
MVESGVTEWELEEELLLARARLAVAIEEQADPDIVQRLHEAVIKAVQKNIELKIKLEGLIKRDEAEALLQKAIRVVVAYVPDSLKSQCFDELTRCLAGGGPEGAGILSADAVVLAELGPGEPEL